MKKNKLYLFILVACFSGYSWLIFSTKISQQNKFTPCVFKNITHLSCPSCGTTRAVIAVSKGDFLSALVINPFGLVVAGIMLVCPFWISYDYMLKKDSLHQFYLKSETILQKKKVYIPLLILVLLNWIWNINKNL
ncbi:DUF2752 domain-containing protein [uncultured Flavobacterium sp.]|uniref:DUF2752 domain-containing protein n=1 Tax=uncultured Flavobacterium sp. TaxID=165435 RepID=UPI0030CA5AAF|tara:strand:+ start:1139 stop:1543 length:405 start_codon:yes stop_codon:yes gene_type:complete